jgi:uncharacterized protein YlaN (UPF0358 family)
MKSWPILVELGLGDPRGRRLLANRCGTCRRWRAELQTRGTLILGVQARGTLYSGTARPIVHSMALKSQCLGPCEMFESGVDTRLFLGLSRDICDRVTELIAHTNNRLLLIPLEKQRLDLRTRPFCRSLPDRLCVVLLLHRLEPNLPQHHGSKRPNLHPQSAPYFF